jgi:hypothetical protein
MRTFGRTLLIMLPVLGVLVPALSQSSLGNQKAEKVEEKQVALKSIFSTSRQKGLKVVERGEGKAYDHELEELYQRCTDGVGASNVFLARGDDIAAAVKAT